MQTHSPSKSNQSPFKIAVIGGGPSASMATYVLQKRGADVVQFFDGKRPSLIVGESLIPGVLPCFKRMGILEKVPTIGTKKPGGSFIFGPTDEEYFEVSFGNAGGKATDYSYNVARPELDDMLDQAALETGAPRVKFRAVLEKDRDDRIRLSDETIAAAGDLLNGRQPDLIVDATGRRRTIAKLMDIPYFSGPRDDHAHFAHFKDVEWTSRPNEVLVNRIQGGWCWRIPLHNRVSIGIVVNKDDAKKLGANPTERLENVVYKDPLIRTHCANSKRITDVMTYRNYQLISDYGRGPNWVTTGDAFGFVDPMLSSGMFLALRSAEMLGDALPLDGNPAELNVALMEYEKTMKNILRDWIELVELIYNGQAFAAQHVGLKLLHKQNNRWNRLMNSLAETSFSRLTAGVSTRKDLRVVQFMASHGMQAFLRWYAGGHIKPSDLAFTGDQAEWNEFAHAVG